MDNQRHTDNQSAQLFYIIGPSGSGKDSIISQIRSEWPMHIMVAHRYITRRADAGNENHVALSSDEFYKRKERQLFSLNWYANGHHYGIGCEVDVWLRKGVDVIVNGSRAHLPQAQQRYGDSLVPIVITVDHQVLKERLIARGRETLEEINQRLTRSLSLKSTVINQAMTLDNSGHLKQTVEPFNRYYQQKLKSISQYLASE